MINTKIQKQIDFLNVLLDSKTTKEICNFFNKEPKGLIPETRSKNPILSDFDTNSTDQHEIKGYMKRLQQIYDQNSQIYQISATETRIYQSKENMNGPNENQRDRQPLPFQRCSDTT